ITILDNGEVVYNGSVKKLSGGRKIKYNFQLKASADKEKFIGVIEKFKGAEILEVEKNNVVIVKLQKQDLIYELANTLMKKGVNVKQYSRIMLSLQDIYNQFVKKGSVDTPEELKAGKSA
ncbi:MAG: hypothetical protein KAG14_03100, partial [Mycoplasmataceae bacterium]|nr:hypothetical protein [Mycoplasmataceae bacterium]